MFRSLQLFWSHVFRSFHFFFLRVPPQIQNATTGVATYKQLSSDNWNDSFPTYSPDSQTIAFVSDLSGSPSLFLMNSDGSHVTSLFSSPDVVNISNPRFGPTGSEIAFIATFRNGSSGLLKIGTDGKGLKQLTHNGENIESFCWSPNGETIAYDEYRGGTWSVWLASPSNESESIPLISGSNQRNYNYQYPFWGPNGTWIVFSSDLAGHNRYNIWSFNLKSGDLSQFTSGQGNDTRPSVSPNGVYVSYVSYDKSDVEWTLWVANANGSNAHFGKQSSGPKPRHRLDTSGFACILSHVESRVKWRHVLLRSIQCRQPNQRECIRLLHRSQRLGVQTHRA